MSLLKQQQMCFLLIPSKIMLNSFQGKNKFYTVLILKGLNPLSPALRSLQDQTVLSSRSCIAEQQKFNVLAG